MRIRNFFLVNGLIFMILFLAGCSSPGEETGDMIRGKVPVTLAGIGTGTLAETIELNATTAFLDHAVIKSPAAAFVQKTLVNQGDFVKKGELLFLLKTREAQVLTEDTANPLAFSGVIRVTSDVDGIVTALDHPDGDFIQEGDQLGSISLPESLVYMLEVPVEQVGLAKINTGCTILLPEGKRLNGTVAARLPLVSPEAQTQQFMVTSPAVSGIPEHLRTKVILTTSVHPNAVTLPKSCVLTDEIMQHFWVMKMINDTVAVKVPVKRGITQGEQVEIIDPLFVEEDRFLASGNYGLGDTAIVQVITGEVNE